MLISWWKFQGHGWTFSFVFFLFKNKHIRYSIVIQFSLWNNIRISITILTQFSLFFIFLFYFIFCSSIIFLYHRTDKSLNIQRKNNENFLHFPSIPSHNFLSFFFFLLPSELCALRTKKMENILLFHGRIVLIPIFSTKPKKRRENGKKNCDRMKGRKWKLCNNMVICVVHNIFPRDKMRRENRWKIPKLLSLETTEWKIKMCDFCFNLNKVLKFMLLRFA